MRVLFLTNIPAPYRVKFFNELGKLCELTVLYELKNSKERNEKWQADNSKNFQEIYLSGIRLRTDAAINLGILKYLDSKKYDVIVVGGYSTPTGMLAIQYMRMKKIKFILNCDGGMIKEDKKIVYKVKKHFIGSAEAWLSTGNVCNKYLKYYGANDKRIYVYPFTSISESEISRADIDKKELRKKLRIKNKKVVISVGQFIYRKGFDLLIKAMEGIQGDVALYIIGGQPTEEYLKIIEKLNIKNISFLDFMSEKELKEWYRAADLFVLPTREDIWGLVINEAMAQGLPIITTDKCVAGLELVNEENGKIVEADNVEELKKAIQNLIADDNLEDKSRNSIKKIEGYTIESMAKKVKLIMEGSRK